MIKIVILFLTFSFIADGGLYLSRFNNVRIMGGEPTTIEEFPYQVSVIYIDCHFCGGSLIKPEYVLTAAHCTDNHVADDLMVRAGSTIVDSGGQLVQVSEINQHQKFDSDNFDYDIAVLKLIQPLQLGIGVAVIPLPPQSNTVAEGINAIATGWGRLYENGPAPMELQKVVLPTFSENYCKTIYANKLTGTMFCAGYVKGGKDTCQGDSGGPLAGNGVLLGVTSWGDGCGEANTPGVYTKVAIFRNYIDNIINN